MLPPRFVEWVTACWIPPCGWAWFVQLFGVDAHSWASWGPAVFWIPITTLGCFIMWNEEDEAESAAQ